MPVKTKVAAEENPRRRRRRRRNPDEVEAVAPKAENPRRRRRRRNPDEVETKVAAEENPRRRRRRRNPDDAPEVDMRYTPRVTPKKETDYSDRWMNPGVEDPTERMRLEHLRKNPEAQKRAASKIVNL